MKIVGKALGLISFQLFHYQLRDNDFVIQFIQMRTQMNVKSNINQIKQNTLKSREQHLKAEIQKAEKRKAQLKVCNQKMKTKIKQLKKQSSLNHNNFNSYSTNHTNKENSNLNSQSKSLSQIKCIQKQLEQELLEFQDRLQKQTIQNQNNIEKLLCRIQEYKLLCEGKNKQKTQNSLNTSLNTSLSIKPTQRGRKTMSVNLANSFSSNNISLISHSKNINEYETNSTNRAKAQRSSRILNDSSMINTSSCFEGMKKKNKSYGKIITKLKCEGCFSEFRPNQYYKHIQGCFGFMKKKLLQQKQQIDLEIDRTLRVEQNDQYI